MATKYVILMPNLFYGHEKKSLSTSSKQLTIYDLKGSFRGRYVKQALRSKDPDRVLLDQNLMEMTGGFPLPLRVHFNISDLSSPPFISTLLPYHPPLPLLFLSVPTLSSTLECNFS